MHNSRMVRSTHQTMAHKMISIMPPLLVILAFGFITLFLVYGKATDALNHVESQPAILQEYLKQQGERDTVVASLQRRFGKPFVQFDRSDYQNFLKQLNLSRDQDLWKWSHFTGIPIVAVVRSRQFFRANAHLLNETNTALQISQEKLSKFSGRYRGGKLTLKDENGNVQSLLDNASELIRKSSITGQLRHNPNFAEDSINLKAFSGHLAELNSVPQRMEVMNQLKELPLSIVKVLRGKAIYLSTYRGKSREAIWHYIGSDLKADYAGMRPGVFLEDSADGKHGDALVRALARLIRETVLEREYFGLYIYPNQFRAFHALSPERRRIFGRRRDILQQTEYGYINAAAKVNPNANFVEHLHAYLTMYDQFVTLAKTQSAAGHPELQEKLDFMQTLVEQTPTVMEMASPERIANIDIQRQERILKEYLRRQLQEKSVRAEVEQAFGKPFADFTKADYDEFMAGLDLMNDDDFWKWSHVTNIPVASLNRRSTTFHLNWNLIADPMKSQLMEYAQNPSSKYNEQTGQVELFDRETNVSIPSLRIPNGTVRELETTDGARHNKGFTEDRITYETLVHNLYPIAELENREEINRGIRMLPLNIVKAYRGKALYPTPLSRTGWAVTWRVSDTKTLSYVGMIPGSFVEARRTPARVKSAPQDLVDLGYSSLYGGSADSLVHEVGHIIDHAVIGGRSSVNSFPFQFPEFRALLAEKESVFGAGDDKVKQTDWGYISSYAKTNAQESFAEHFWAYLRDRAGFLRRAENEKSQGHPELLDKFRYMEKLIDRTEGKMVLLSAEFFGQQRNSALESEKLRQQEKPPILQEYLTEQARKMIVRQEVETRFGKPFHQFTDEEYAALMTEFDFSKDEDIFKWSHITDIPVLALDQGPNFFFSNSHLMQDLAAAKNQSWEQMWNKEVYYDAEKDEIQLRTEQGEPIATRKLPPGTMGLSERSEGYWYIKNFGLDKITFEALAPNLIRFSDVSYRSSMGGYIRSLSRAIVQIYRGKGIYFINRNGRSWALTMAVSNTKSTSFIGLQTGAFIELRSDGATGTAQNFVHEIGHIVDYGILRGGYGSYRHPHQFPRIREMKERKENIFGVQDDKVPQTDWGYITRYSKTNAQENFADHFRAFVTEKQKFHAKAEKELAEGHDELMRKYKFMATMLEKTPTTMTRLSPEYLQ